MVSKIMKPRSILRLGAIAAVACIATSPSTSRAQANEDLSAADELFNRGKELLKAGNWSEGCAKFEASMALDAAVATLLKIARCREHEGKLAAAMHDYRDALKLNREKTDLPKRRGELENLTQHAIEQLEPRVPKFRVIVHNPPAGLHVVFDGKDLPSAAFGEELPADAGTVEIVAQAPGFQPERRTFTLAEGARMDVVLTLWPAAGDATPLQSAAAAPDAVEGTPAAEPKRDQAGQPAVQRSLGFVVGGAGLVGLGVAAGFGIDTLLKVGQSSSHCQSSGFCDATGVRLRHDAGDSQTTALVSLAIGAPLLVAGTVLVLTAPSRISLGRTSAAASLAVGVGSIVLRGSW
jgi:hypothetical protein